MDANLLNMKIEPIDSKYSPYKAEESLKAGIYIPLQNPIKGRAKKLMDSSKTSSRRQTENTPTFSFYNKNQAS